MCTHFFSIWTRCCASCVASLLVKKPECSWVTFTDTASHDEFWQKNLFNLRQLQHQEASALLCFLSSFISKLTKAHRNQIKWLPRSHAVSSSFCMGSQEDTCGSQPSSVTSRPHSLTHEQCNEFRLNIKLQLLAMKKSSLGSCICSNLSFPEEFLTAVSTAFPVDHAHHSGAGVSREGFKGLCNSGQCFLLVVSRVRWEDASLYIQTELWGGLPLMHHAPSCELVNDISRKL